MEYEDCESAEHTLLNCCRYHTIPYQLSSVAIAAFSSIHRPLASPLLRYVCIYLYLQAVIRTDWLVCIEPLSSTYSRTHSLTQWLSLIHQPSDGLMIVFLSTHHHHHHHHHHLHHHIYHHIHHQVQSKYRLQVTVETRKPIAISPTPAHDSPLGKPPSLITPVHIPDAHQSRRTGHTDLHMHSTLRVVHFTSQLPKRYSPSWPSPAQPSRSQPIPEPTPCRFW